jgi:hypothetical protein
MVLHSGRPPSPLHPRSTPTAARKSSFWMAGLRHRHLLASPPPPLASLVTPFPAAIVKCSLVRNFFTRLGVLFLGALLYVAYTANRMSRGDDQRSLSEFCAMFFNLGAHQAVGGLMLLVYSQMQSGLDPLVWYAATFDFEFVFTMLYIKTVKTVCAPLCFECFRPWTGATLFLGQVGDCSGQFRWRYFVAQFVVSVGVVGVTSRLLSMTTISLLQSRWMPLNPVRELASFYYSLQLGCYGEALLALYIKPALLDALTFAISDWLLSSRKSLPRDQRFGLDGAEILA